MELEDLSQAIEHGERFPEGCGRLPPRRPYFARDSPGFNRTAST
jgi:hypothetical protein